MKKLALLFLILATLSFRAVGEAASGSEPIAAKIDASTARSSADILLGSSVEPSKRIYLYKASHSGTVDLLDLAPLAILSLDDFPTLAALKKSPLLKKPEERFFFVFTGKEDARWGALEGVVPRPDNRLGAGDVVLVTPNLGSARDF